MSWRPSSTSGLLRSKGSSGVQPLQPAEKDEPTAPAHATANRGPATREIHLRDLRLLATALLLSGGLLRALDGRVFVPVGSVGLVPAARGEEEGRHPAELHRRGLLASERGGGVARLEYAECCFAD